MSVPSLDSHIEVTPGVCGGKPRIAGRRITVQNVVVWHEHLGMGGDEIATEHDLSLSEIYAALAYYFDHRSDIDQAIREDQELAATLKRISPSKLQEKLRGLP